MAVGDVHVLESAKVRVKFTEHATYKVVLTSIENLEDGSLQSFAPQSPFRVKVRDVATTDAFEPDAVSNVASSYAVTGVGYDASTFHLGSNYEQPALGGRKWFQAVFDYSVPGDSLRIYFTAQLLDSHPDRVRFALYVDTKRFGGGLTTTAAFWCAPILLAVPTFVVDQYFIAVGMGLTTKSPKIDLVGDGASYRFPTGRKPGITTLAEELVSATAFEPETKGAQFSDRMEVMYPTWMSSACSGYGDSSPLGTTVYAHDDLRFVGRRFLDFYSGGNVLLEQEGLVENGIAAANGWTIATDADLRATSTYVRVFRRSGDVLGEEIGLDYRRWSTTCSEFAANMPAKTKDREDVAPMVQMTPIFRVYYNDDDEGQTGLTATIADETRAAFPAIDDDCPLLRMNYDTLFPMFQDASATHPGKVGDTLYDAWDFHCDQAKKDHSQQLFDEKLLYTGVFNNARRPSPYDGRAFWNSDGMSAARIKNHLEAANPGAYKTTDQWLKVSRTVASRSFNGTFTKITLSGAALDPSLWNRFSSYAGTTAGINHAAHPDHLGWIDKPAATEWAFPIERQVQADFTANPPIIYVAGDQTATVQVNDAVDLYFTAQGAIPGYDPQGNGRVGDNAQTSLCAMADAIGNQGATAGGWATRFIEQWILEGRPHFTIYCSILTRYDPICWGSHGGETPGSNQQILAWRRVLARMRASVPQPFQIMEEDGPYDWMVGLVDGHTRTVRRLDITTLVSHPSSPSGWGVSPFFQTVWGEYYRFGGFQGAFEGHVTNFGGASIYDAVWGGTGQKNYREAMVGDVMVGYLPTVGVSPNPAHSLGTVTGLGTVYMPWNHPTIGRSAPTSFAALLCRLVQLNLHYKNAIYLGRRMRSLVRYGQSTVDYAPLSVSFGHEDFHSIGVDENGKKRKPIFDAVFLDHVSPRRLLAVFVNDGTVGRKDEYEFDPEHYPELLPMGARGYSVTRTTVNHDGVTSESLPSATGEFEFDVELGPGEVVVYEFALSPAASATADSSIVVGKNSYASVSDADERLATSVRASSRWPLLSRAQKESALVTFFRQLELQRWAGTSSALRNASTAAVASAGSGYAAGDVVSAVGGSGKPASFEVAEVDGAGAVAKLLLVDAGEYGAVPEGDVGTETGGDGSGLTLSMSFVAQQTLWPRGGVVDRNGQAVDASSFPPNLVAAQIEGAFELSQNMKLETKATQNSNVRSLQAGSVGVEFFRPNDQAGRFPAVVQELIEDLLAGTAATGAPIATGTGAESMLADDESVEGVG